MKRPASRSDCVALWPVLLETERAALRSQLNLSSQPLRDARVIVVPDGVPRRIPIKSDRNWSTGEIARLGNIWDRIMEGTGAQGLLNASGE